MKFLVVVLASFLAIPASAQPLQVASCAPILLWPSDFKPEFLMSIEVHETELHPDSYQVIDLAIEALAEEGYASLQIAPRHLFDSDAEQSPNSPFHQSLIDRRLELVVEALSERGAMLESTLYVRAAEPEGIRVGPIGCSRSNLLIVDILTN